MVRSERMLHAYPRVAVQVRNLDLLLRIDCRVTAALPLFAGGLGVIGWMARRKKRGKAAQA